MAYSPISIGIRVINTIELAMLQNTRGNYSIKEYIRDFKGTPEELEIELIKLAAKELDGS